MMLYDRSKKISKKNKGLHINICCPFLLCYEQPFRPQSSVFTTPNVNGPKNPVLGMLYAFWKLTSAAYVRTPNFSVSLPGDPGPDTAIVKPWRLRNC